MTRLCFVQANPSQAEAIYRDFKAKKAKLTTQKKVDVSEKYGNAASADKPEDELLLGQTEVYREYDASGASPHLDHTTIDICAVLLPLVRQALIAITPASQAWNRLHLSGSQYPFKNGV